MSGVSNYVGCRVEGGWWRVEGSPTSSKLARRVRQGEKCRVCRGQGVSGVGCGRKVSGVGRRVSDGEWRFESSLSSSRTRSAGVSGC